MSDYTDALYLAGLLHDIGKFWQRADPSGEPQSRILSAQTKNLISILCPTNPRSQKPTHKHVLWTAQFFESYGHLFKGDVRIATPQDCSLERLASAHHNPGNAWERIVQLADHYASSSDRSKIKEEELLAAADESKAGWDRFKSVPLDSILESVDLSGADGPQPGASPKRAWRMPAQALGLSEADLFPIPRDEPQARLSQEVYARLWAGFSGHLTNYKPRSVTALCDALMTRLWVYAACFPSSTLSDGLPDVSLYDHLKITGAFSACLYRYLVSQPKYADFNSQTDWRIDDTEAPVVLVGADLSGIQSFIYNVSSRQAAKNLKARSFYLQQTATAACRYVLEEPGLQAGHILYASGGGFYLLAPNTPAVVSKLGEIRQTLESCLFETHGTDIYLALASRPLTDGELMEPDRNARSRVLAKAWGDLTAQLAEQKRRRYAAPLADRFDDFFAPQDIGGRNPLDAITGEEIPQGKVEDWSEGSDTGDSLKLHAQTHHILELGRRLRSTEMLALGRQQAGTSLAGLMNTYSIEEQQSPPPRANYLVVLNDPQRALEASNTHPALAVSLGFYGGNRYPHHDDRDESPKTFNELAGAPEDLRREQALQLARLGVLRMDVDSLGQIFQRGLRDRNTLSRMATLSRTLDAFFQGYLNTLHQTGTTEAGEAFADHTYIIYSGGDDLFIVGRWDVALELGEQVRKQFAAFCGHNPSLGLSGGLAIVPPKYPIAKAADLAAEAEKAAKEHTTERGEKDAFCLAGMGLTVQRPVKGAAEPSLAPLRWDSEWLLVRRLQRDIQSYLQDDALPKSFLTHVAALYAQRAEGSEYEWRWRMAYNWARLKERLGKDQEPLLQQLDAWLQLLTLGRTAKGFPTELEHSGYDFFDLFQLAARLAELTHRTKPKS